MIIIKKMPDESFEEIEVDESQAEFLIKHEPFRYEIKKQSALKENKSIKEAEEIEIPDFTDED